MEVTAITPKRVGHHTEETETNRGALQPRMMETIKRHEKHMEGHVDKPTWRHTEGHDSAQRAAVTH